MKNEVIQNIQLLRDSKTPCAQATLVGVFRGLEKFYPQEDILRAAASGLRGGIGRTYNQGSCGALTGAAIAIGLLFPDDTEKAVQLSNELFNGFKQEFGTVICGAITNKHGLERCTECCLFAGCKVAELYERETINTLDIHNCEKP